MNSRISAVVRHARLFGCALVLGGAVTACGMDSSDGAAAGDTRATANVDDRDRVPSNEELAACGPGAPPDGAVQWKHDFGVTGSLAPASVASDAAGNVFHASQATGVSKLKTDGSSVALAWHVAFGNVVAVHAAGDSYVGSASSAATGAAVTKLDSNGATVWTRAVGTGTPQSIAVAADSSVLVSGAGLGTIRLDAQGQVQWTKPFGGFVALAKNGDALITGSFEGTVDLGAGPVVSSGRADAFIVRLSAQGQYVWSHTVGDATLPISRPGGGTVTQPSDQLGQGIAEAPNGDVVVAGFARDSVKLFGDDDAAPFNPDAGLLSLIYVARLDGQGKVLWKTHEIAFRGVRGLTVDPRGNAIVSGGQIGHAPPYVLTWIKKYDPAGATVWTRPEAFGSGYADSVTTDTCGNIVLGLETAAQPGASVHGYVAKLRP